MVNIRNPWAFQDILQELDRMGDATGWVFGKPSLPAGASSAGVQIQEDTARIVVDLPGVQTDDLSIQLEDKRLSIEASRSDRAGKEEEILLRERSYGSFQQSYALPWEVHEESIEAQLKNGVLTVTVQRAPETAPRRIEVQSA